jgi:hypothetical protein
MTYKHFAIRSPSDVPRHWTRPSPRSVRQLKRRILRTRSEAGALLRHVALDVGKDGLEFGFVADRGEIGIEVADSATYDATGTGLRVTQ